MSDQTPTASIMFTTQLGRVRAYRADDVDPFIATLSARCTALEQERATLTARCEALEQDRNDFRQEVHNLAKACTDTPLERDTLKMWCEALTAERDKAQMFAGVRANMLRYIAFVTTGDETGDPQLGADQLKARCQHLEQAIQQYVESETFDALAYRYRTSPKEDAGSVMNAFDALKDGILAAVRLSQPQTDENRVSFAAGYTAALDDALKGTT